MSLTGIAAATLKLVTGGTTYTQELDVSSLTSGSNSVKITNQTLISALNNALLGDSFTPSVEVTYGNDESGIPITRTTNAASAFIPKVISLANIPNKYTDDVPFSISTFLTTISTGALTYSSSNTSVATINSSTGLITPVGEGTSMITANVAETANHIAGSASTTLTILPLLRLASNGVTIQYTGAAGDVPTSSPRYIEANPRGTGVEWFAVIKDAHKANLKDYIGTHVVAGTPPTPYGLSGAGVSSFFTPPGLSAPVNINNIITTLVTDMSSLFWGRYLFNNTLDSWDTSNVTNMSFMFGYQAQSDSRTYGFNHPSIQYWNTSKVQNFSRMFENNYAFKQDVLNGWDTSSATDMSRMFYEYDFDLTLTNWNTSNVVNMENMFRISAQTKDISMWDVTNVTNWFWFKAGTNSLFSLDKIPAKFRDGQAG
jgi:surface protein